MNTRRKVGQAEADIHLHIFLWIKTPTLAKNKKWRSLSAQTSVYYLEYSINGLTWEVLNPNKRCMVKPKY